MQSIVAWNGMDLNVDTWDHSRRIVSTVVLEGKVLTSLL